MVTVNHQLLFVAVLAWSLVGLAENTRTTIKTTNGGVSGNRDAGNGNSTGISTAAVISGSSTVSVGSGSDQSSRRSSTSSTVGDNSFCEYRCLLGVSCTSGSTACQNTIFVAGSFYCRFVSGCPDGKPPFSIIYIPFSPVIAAASTQPAASASRIASTTSTATTSGGTGIAAAASASQISTESGTSGGIGISTSTISPGSTTISGVVVTDVHVPVQVQVIDSTEVKLPEEVVKILGHVDSSTQATSGKPGRRSYISVSVGTGG